MGQESAVRWDSDVLVIGGGIAGAFAAIKAREAGADVILVDKAFFGRSGCSSLASGVFATFFPGDDPEHWASRYGIKNPFVNEELLRKTLPVTYECVMLMDRWGVRWVKEGGNILRVPTVGAPEPHNVMMDGGGPMLMLALRNEALRRGVRVVNRVMLQELLTSDGQLPTQGRVTGAIGLHTRSGQLQLFRSRKVILATGFYNIPFLPLEVSPGMPRDLAGDGIAMMLRAGAVMGKLDFGITTLRPWDFFTAPGLEMFFGLGGTAIFQNSLGDPYLAGQRMSGRHDVYGALAKEMTEGRGPVYVSLTHLTPEQRRLLRRVLPIIMSNWEAAGYDPAQDPVPYVTVPSASKGVPYGGARVNDAMETSIPGLYGAGNCTDGAYMAIAQPLHFCAVQGYWAGQNAGRSYREVEPPAMVEGQVQELSRSLTAPLALGGSYAEAHSRLAEIYRDHIGMTLKGHDNMAWALGIVQEVLHERLPRVGARDQRELVKVLGLRNACQVLETTLRILMHRTESRANVIRWDYPYTDNEGWLCYTRARKEPSPGRVASGDSGEVRIWDEPLPEERKALAGAKRPLHPFFKKMSEMPRRVGAQEQDQWQLEG